MGVRIGHEEVGITTTYVRDYTEQTNQILSETTGAMTRSYLWDSQELVALETGTEKSLLYYRNDHLGSPVRMMGKDGKVVATYGYDEFGRDQYIEGSGYDIQGSEQPYGYTGYRYDEIGNTWHANAREYRAEIGRFTSKDEDAYLQIEQPQSLNQYMYCLANPLRYTDPLGHEPEKVQKLKKAAEIMSYITNSISDTIFWNKMLPHMSYTRKNGVSISVGEFDKPDIDLTKMYNSQIDKLMDSSFGEAFAMASPGGILATKKALEKAIVQGMLKGGKSFGKTFVKEYKNGQESMKGYEGSGLKVAGEMAIGMVTLKEGFSEAAILYKELFCNKTFAVSLAKNFVSTENIVPIKWFNLRFAVTAAKTESGQIILQGVKSSIVEVFRIIKEGTPREQGELKGRAVIEVALFASIVAGVVGKAKAIGNAGKGEKLLKTAGTAEVKTGTATASATEIAGEASLAKASEAAKISEGGGNSSLYDEFSKLKTPEDRYDYLLDKAKTMDVSTPKNGAIFYAGRVETANGTITARQMAERYVEQLFESKGVKKYTLEKTHGGKWMDDLQLYKELPDGTYKYESLGLSESQANNLWNTLSGRYADGASGAVTAFVKNVPDSVKPKTVFYSTEFPKLRFENDMVTNINIR